MARFYQIKIGTIYLTETGLAGGDPCKLQVSNVEDLLMPITGSAVQAAGGAVVFQLVPWTAGKQFEIAVETLPAVVWNSLKTLLLSALTEETDFEIIGTGDIGNFEVTVKPFPVKPFSAAEFRNGRIKNAIFRFITV